MTARRSASHAAWVLGWVALLASAHAPPAAAGPILPRLLTWEESLRGTDEDELRWPVALATASADELVVAEAYEPRLMLFRKIGVSWQLERSIPLPGSPLALVWDGRRYVAALRGQGLVAFEPPQLLQRRIALPAGVVPGPLAAREDGSLFLYDLARERVLELDAGGEIVRETRLAQRATALAAAPSGGFWVASAAAGTVASYDAAGQPQATWTLPGEAPVPAWPVALCVEPAGDVAIVDRHGGRILFLDVGGKPVGIGSRRGWEPGLLRFPSAIARLGDGRLVVADQGNGRVQIFRRSDGTP